MTQHSLKTINILFAICSWLLISSHAAAHIPDGKRSLAPMLERITPGVVNIATRGREVVRSPMFNDPFFDFFFGQRRQQQTQETQSLGSGVIVDAKNGYVLTNHHVVENATRITVTLRDGREQQARFVGSDPATDVAVIQIPADNLTAVPYGQSAKLRVGDFVVAIGNPFGLGQTVTSGIVSALGRSGLGIEKYENFIQTDASINQGNSGGALVDLNGQLIGINTAIVAPNGGNVGIGFAIPIDTARQLMTQLINFGEVRRGKLGLTAQDLTADLASAFGLKNVRGALITAIFPDSPAAAAGLRVQDVIIAVNNQPVKNQQQLGNALGLAPVDQAIPITIVRDGRQRTVQATLIEPKRVELDNDLLSEHIGGAVLADLVTDHPLFGRVTGVQISRVQRGSPAERIDLREGDVITAINRQVINDLDHFRKVVNRARNRNILLRIQRGSEIFLLNLR